VNNVALLRRAKRDAALTFYPAMRYHLCSSFTLTLIFVAFQPSAFSEEFSGIAEPENCAIVLAVAAEGVQIYESKPNPSGGFQWSLKAPEAELKSASGQVLGKHGAGPSWTLNDGSSIVGSLPPLKNVAASGSIPWLLIAVKSKSGSGTLDKVDYVLRVATDGGVAPVEPPAVDGATTRVKYHAIYVFFRRLPG
jgi:Protein of unknown function (DUF3455)